MPRKTNRRQFLTRTAAATLAAGIYVPKLVHAADAQWGDLTGQFIYDGKAPERKKLTVDKDVDCCGKFDIRDESLMVAEDGSLQNVYVYVRTRGVEICPELEQSVEKQMTLDNRDCIFATHCMTIWYTKQEFHIVNSDPVAQNVAFSPLGDAPANIVIPAATKDKQTEATWKFSRKQRIPVRVLCNYHPWELAHILPSDHPYAAVSAKDGVFTIAKLPVGELEFQVWHEKVGYLATPKWSKGRFKMTVKPGANDLGTVKIDPKLLTGKKG